MTYVKDSRTGYQSKITDVDAAIAAHEAAADPHPTYLTQAEGDAAYSALGHNHDADYADIAHTHVLNDLTDVNAPSPTDAYVLTWDSGTSKWIAAAAPGASSGLAEGEVIALIMGLS